MLNRITLACCLALAAIAIVPAAWAAEGNPAVLSPGGSQTAVADAAQAGSNASRTSYTIASGDLIEVNLLDEPELSGKFRVSGSGDIEMSVGGAIHLAGMTVEEAAAAIERRLASANLLREPHATVFVSDYASPGVTVMGEVKSPGIYPLFGEHGLYDAISSAGGLTIAASSEISVIHHNDPSKPQIVELSNSSQLLADHDVAIFPGDKVIVPTAGIVYAVGEVARPGGFVLSRNESSYSVMKVLALAEGTTHTAKLNKAVVIRKTDNGLVQYRVQIAKIFDGKAPDMLLKAGDVLYVPSSPAKLVGYRALEAAFATTSGVLTYKAF